ncbi:MULTISPECIES: methylated-DNA--[protein]-cysteine S-methyltransferase [unclassified Diaminobutyricimonas]|uniref:methylated-DNA--[protein]-cysteine S-methyltransferase n=1 Tax=unclassified Diaminobutyricimonas TaxID=2643261 RepID=UPI0012F508A7|nr:MULTISPECIES: methylated-DNA--[protein]-cysteine S-methyltransferase [unclassified Diaminobutyricimonas]
MTNSILDAIPTHDPDASARLHEKLVREAEAEGILDVGYRTIDTPIGALLLAATEHGLVRVAFALEGHELVLERLASVISPRILHAPHRLDAAARQLDEYFAGTRTRFELPLDWRLAKGFRLSVIQQLPTIEYGHTASYAELAAAAGNPGAVRAVGTACATNPLPIVVPCHRVVRSDGTIGQYLGGTPVKVTLLELESAA